MTTPLITHINAWAKSDQVQHVLDVACWCNPVVTHFVAHTVVDHAGKPQPSVLKVPVFQREYDPVRNGHRVSGVRCAVYETR